jgi:hypothetical protein
MANGVASESARTFLLVHSHNDCDLVTPDANELLNGTDTSSREFGK